MAMAWMSRVLPAMKYSQVLAAVDIELIKMEESLMTSVDSDPSPRSKPHTTIPSLLHHAS